MRNGRVVQSKEIAYAVPRGAIVDQKKKKGFHMVLKWVKMLEVVRDEVEEWDKARLRKQSGDRINIK